MTPFLVYFIENVYHKLVTALPAPSITDAFQRALEQGNVTEKEQALWHFVLTAYGSSEFSTKQLEKAFGNAAYATIRGFVLKFEKLGLLRAAKDMATESNTESKCEKRSDFSGGGEDQAFRACLMHRGLLLIFDTFDLESPND